MSKKLLSYLLLTCSFQTWSQSKVTELYDISPGTNITTSETSLKTWIDTILGQLFYVDHNFSQNLHHDNEFHRLKLATKDTLVITLPDTPVKLTFNTKIGKRFRTTQTILADYEFRIIGQAQGAFRPMQFDFTPSAYFSLACKARRYYDGDVLAHTFNTQIDTDYEKPVSKYQLIIDRINKLKKTKIPYPDKRHENITWLKDEISKSFKDIPALIYELYINDKNEEKTWRNIQGFFFGEDIKYYIDNLINIKTTIAFENAENLLLPSNWLADSDINTKGYTAIPFKRIVSIYNRAKKRYEITLEISDKSELNFRHGSFDKYSPKKKRYDTTIISDKVTQKIRPTSLVIYVEINNIKGVLETDADYPITLFDNKREL